MKKEGIKNEKYLVLGAGGHAKVVIDILLQNNIENIIIFDDNTTSAIFNIPIKGKISTSINHGTSKAVIAIGDNNIREKISKKYKLDYFQCLHPTSVIANGVAVGDGTVVMANAVINSGSTIGKHCIINTSAIVEHDNKIGDYVHVSPGVKLGGNVKIGKNTWIGIGATIKNNVTICNDVIIGAGAIVVNDIVVPGTYVGIPARVK